jgi:hypothetical protein
MITRGNPESNGAAVIVDSRLGHLPADIERRSPSEQCQLAAREALTLLAESLDCLNESLTALVNPTGVDSRRVTQLMKRRDALAKWFDAHRKRTTEALHAGP